MRFLFLLNVFTLIVSCQIEDKSWIRLFNGKDLSGWEHVGEGSFEVVDGMLITKGGMGLLWYTKQKFQDCKIKVVFTGQDKNNAGVFIRIPERPIEAWMPVNKGYEVQIDDREDEYHKTGVLYSMTKAKAKPSMVRKWNTMVITLDGNRTLVEVNGTLITDFVEGDLVPEKKYSWEPDRGPRPITGYIGLQNHGLDDLIYFKEVSFKKLKS
jgi:hypothetical protein